MRIVLAGAVQSSRVTLESLVRHRADVVLVLGYEPKDRALVSGYADLSACARANSIPYLGFQSVNHPSVIERVREGASTFGLYPPDAASKQAYEAWRAKRK